MEHGRTELAVIVPENGSNAKLHTTRLIVR